MIMYVCFGGMVVTYREIITPLNDPEKNRRPAAKNTLRKEEKTVDFEDA